MTYEISMPRFESLAIKDLILNAKNILEYGAGGTTYFAYQNNKAITTVETDKDYLDNLLEACNYSDLIRANYVDIGETIEWGYSNQLPEGFNTIRQYIRPPWEEDNFDLVIVDGRFRVATFMFNWNRANIDTVIFWDDFLNRKHYKEVLKYVKPYAYIGRAAVFIKDNRGIKFSDEVIHNYVTDQR